MQDRQKNIKIWVGEMEDYKLLDSGNKKKLEEIRGTRIVRAEPRAWWEKELSEGEWEKAAASLDFTKAMTGKQYAAPKQLEKIIDIGISGIRAKIKLKETSKHIGIFPEQFPQWKWIIENLLKIENSKLKILNLFGYTGIASLVAVKAGARVTHVDASKQSVDWARENQKLSGLQDAPIRWIVDDVVKFLKREKKRLARRSLDEVESGYDAIIMDPPSYGKGPRGEVWKIEEKLPDLLSACREILSDNPSFVIFNMYSTELSSISATNLLSDMMRGLGGQIQAGELAIKHHGSDKLLPMSIFALWQTE